MDCQFACHGVALGVDLEPAFRGAMDMAALLPLKKPNTKPPELHELWGFGVALSSWFSKGGQPPMSS